MEHELNIEKFKKLHSVGNAQRMLYRLMSHSKIIHSHEGDDLQTFGVFFCTTGTFIKPKLLVPSSERSSYLVALFVSMTTIKMKSQDQN